MGVAAKVSGFAAFVIWKRHRRLTRHHGGCRSDDRSLHGVDRLVRVQENWKDGDFGEILCA